ncbi:hypothetical protein C1N70_27085 (plasmid) [Cytobacillus firmus]|uniref:Uncharacterized protein n=1 Tax=Cytobacillus oceanisediminis TaxID=665099 RepID=A0ABX3CNW0_9BACI|nr:hypothetical protein BBV17_24340 [Cytobacillus oceanisediminis]
MLYPSGFFLISVKKNKEAKKKVKQSTDQKDEKLAKGSYLFGTTLITILVSFIIFRNRSCNKITKTPQ